MSSHREAPEISKDPVADSTDLYAFVSPDRPDTVTLIANYVPLESPGGRPELLRVRRRRALRDPHRQRRRRRSRISRTSSASTPQLRQPARSCTTPGRSPRWTARAGTGGRSTRSPGSADGAEAATSATRLACPPCNIGPLSTPDYAALAAAAVHTCRGSRQVFAGQRAEGFYVDLGSIFDLGDLRPFQQTCHLRPWPNGLEGGTGRQLHQAAQRAHDRPPGPESTCGRRQRSERPGLGHRRVDDGQPAEGPDAGRRTAPMVTAGPLRPDLAARQPAVQRSGRPDGEEGLLERPAAGRGQAVRAATSRTPSSPNCCPVLYPGVFPNLAAL